MKPSLSEPWKFPLPAGWERLKLKYICTLKGRLGWQNLRADEYTDEGPFLVTSEHFVADRVNWNACHHVTQDRYNMAPEIQLQPNDLLMMKDGAAMGKLAYLDALPDEACLNSHLLLFRPVDGRFPNRFLYYVLGSPLFRSYMEQERTGTTFFGISQENIGNYPLSLPPRHIQSPLVAFLDRKTAAIDAVIAKKQRMIELLNEKRQALISQAVTKGLHAGVAMQDAGIEWLGGIPAHWQTRRLKYLIDGPIEQGWSPQCDSGPADNGEWGVLKVGCVNGEEFDPNEQKALPTEMSPERRYEIRSGDILMSRGNTRELVGSAALVRTVRPRLLLCDLLYRFRANTAAVEPEFLVLALRSRLVRFQIEREATGTSSSMKKISQDDIRNFWVCVPPLAEQRSIVRAVSEEWHRSSGVMACLQIQMNRLYDYREAVIAAAVTGQIDVGKEVA